MLDWMLQAIGAGNDPALRAEAVRGFFGLLGAGLPFMFGFLAWLGDRWVTRWNARQARRARQLDILKALKAEIRAGGRAASLQLTPEERAYAEANPTPFGVPDRTDFVFESVRADLGVLPESVIYEVVLYYRLAEQSNLMTEALASPAFASQRAQERAKFVRQLMDISESQAKAALDALARIDAHLGAPDDDGPSSDAQAPVKRGDGSALS